MGRLDPGDRLFLADRALVDHVGGDAHRRGRRPLRGPCLEHVQAAALDRELEVLDVAVVRLELLADALELGVHLRHLGLHLGDLRGGPDAGDDVLALGVGEVLAEQDLLARVRVPRERDARPGVVAHVAEDHRHDVDRRAEVVGDGLVLAVVAGPLAEPAREHGLDREIELLGWVLREIAARVGLDDRLELGDEVLQGGGVEVGILLCAVLLFGRLEGVVEALAADLHHDPPEHLDESPVGIPPETLVAGQRDETLRRLLVEAEVEDRVHHAGHRELGARAHAHEQRVGGIAEALAGPPLDFLHGLEDVVPQPVGQALAVGEVVVAGLGRDREPGRGGQSRDRHLGETGPFAAQEVAHLGVSLGAAVAPGVDVALGRCVRPVGSLRPWGGGGHR